MNSFQIGLLQKIAQGSAVDFFLGTEEERDRYSRINSSKNSPDSDGWKTKIPQIMDYSKVTDGDEVSETYSWKPKLNISKAPTKPVSLSDGFQIEYKKPKQLTQQQLNEQGKRDLENLRNFKPPVNNNALPPMVAPGAINTAALPYFDG